MTSSKTFLLGSLVMFLTHTAIAAEPNTMDTRMSAIEGTWTLAYADVQHPDGTRGHDYGDAPKGLLQIDHAGHYSMLIFNSTRPKFASSDKNAATPSEFRAAMLGTSSHYGTVQMDPAKGALIFHIEGATFPNWEGTTQVRSYVLNGDMLSYKVPPRPNGDIPMTGWKRISP
jgi:hypothetical protein